MASPAATPAVDPIGVAGSVEGLASIVAERVEDALAFRLKDEWVTMAHLALSGGIVTDAVIEAIADKTTHRIDWTKVHVWWTDERYLVDGHTGRHETKVRAAGLARIGIPEPHIHAVPGPKGDEERPDRAAEEYARTLRKFAPHRKAAPLFDLTLLEVAATGEVAGLYPDHSALRATEPVVPLWDAPRPCPLQVTLAPDVLNKSVRVWKLAAGADRAVAVGRAILGEEGRPPPPAALIRGGFETQWWLEEKAARAIPAEVRGV
ncbi:MAG: 6-phosphogluconolactonase [Mobilicoccus sp.]|nr:6-phosphogluconolactonase [Mobilicoccus sp.]